MKDQKNSKKRTPKGFAKAFKSDIGREKEVIEEKWEIQAERSLLMNPVRQKIFKYLCEYPCSSLSTIARDFQLSSASMSWHLNLMIDRKFITEHRRGGQRLFYPSNMIDRSTIPVLTLLANPKIHDIYIKVLTNPGSTQKEVTDELGMSHQSINSFTNKLREEKLIKVVRDGKFARYYPTKRLSDLELSQRKNLKEFRKWVIKIFKYEGINPKLIRVTDLELFLQVISGSNIESLRLSVNPFHSMVQNKSRFLAEM